MRNTEGGTGVALSNHIRKVPGLSHGCAALVSLTIQRMEHTAVDSKLTIGMCVSVFATIQVVPMPSARGATPAEPLR